MSPFDDRRIAIPNEGKAMVAALQFEMRGGSFRLGCRYPASRSHAPFWGGRGRTSF
ncbi:hypothetical protein LUTEI9C_100223 [Luteimonas sp. 9C]|nr:hypothetical protein LUTEI9C_100223 [Luteimonas sp. 9C]